MKEAFIASSSTITLLGLVLWLSKTWIKERLTADLRLETETKLEELKSQLARANESLSTLTSTGSAAMSQAQAALLQPKVNAIQTAWESVINWQQASAVTTFAAVLPLDWVRKYGSDPSTKSKFDIMLKNLKHLEFLKPLNETELVRPFLSKKGWALYFAYHSFYASRFTKASLLTISGIDHAAIWERTDERDLVAKSAPRELLDEYDANFLIGGTSFLNYLKEQMLEEFQSHLSGKRESDAAVANASAILSSAEKLVASTQHHPAAPGDKPLKKP